LSQTYRVIAPDLRGHGQSDKPVAGHHVSRLAMDLRELIDHLKLPLGQIRAVGGSLGCAVIWSVLFLLLFLFFF
jgi:pimeloyl-ACP methyl ester carboxylesterase